MYQGKKFMFSQNDVGYFGYLYSLQNFTFWAGTRYSKRHRGEIQHLYENI